MFNPNTKTIMQEMMESELTSFRNNYVKGAITKSSLVTSFEGGNVLYPIDSSKQSVTDLLSCANTISYLEQDTIQLNEVDPLFRNTTDKILTLEDTFSYNDAIKEIIPYIKAAGNNFYGALLRKGSTFLNPFHPLTALSVLKSNQTSTYKVILFFYRDRNEMDIKYSSCSADLKRIEHNINSLLRTYTSTVTHESLVVDVEENKNAPGVLRVTSGKKINFGQKETSLKEYYVVTHQLVTKGIISPFYGSSIIRKNQNGGSEGAHISPFRSANISSGERNSMENSETPTIKWNSVCTGNISNSSLQALRRLTHSNLSSPYCTRTIQDGALLYADACIRKSVELYSKAGIIEPVVFDNSFEYKPQLKYDLELIKAVIDYSFMEKYLDTFPSTLAAITAQSEIETYIETNKEFVDEQINNENNTNSTETSSN